MGSKRFAGGCQPRLGSPNVQLQHRENVPHAVRRPDQGQRPTVRLPHRANPEIPTAGGYGLGRFPILTPLRQLPAPRDSPPRTASPTRPLTLGRMGAPESPSLVGAVGMHPLRLLPARSPPNSQPSPPTPPRRRRLSSLSES